MNKLSLITSTLVAVAVFMNGALAQGSSPASAPQSAADARSGLRSPLDERVVIDMPPRWTQSATKRGNLPGAEWWWINFTDTENHANVYVRVERGSFPAALPAWEEEQTSTLLKRWWKDGNFRKIGTKDAVLGSRQSVTFAIHGLDAGGRVTQEFAFLALGDERTRVLIEVYPSHRYGDIAREGYAAVHAAAKAVSFTPGN